MNDTRTEPLVKFTKQSKARMLKLNKEFAESVADSTFFSKRSKKKMLKRYARSQRELSAPPNPGR